VASRDAEVRKVAAELDALLERLAANVGALTTILSQPQHPPEADERLVKP
jgi:hypothetical protein